MYLSNFASRPRYSEVNLEHLSDAMGKSKDYEINAPRRRALIKLSLTMLSKIRITDAGNVVVPAYLTLKKKGFAVCWNASVTDQDTWHAEDATKEFIADDLITLSGLVCMCESRGTDWQACDDEIEDFCSKYESF